MADEVGQADALSILAAHKEQYRSVQVNKDIGVHYDSGNLMVSDVNLLDNDALKRDTDSYLKELTRDNTQLLIGEIWKLPTEKVEDVVVGLLPTPTTVIPRGKPIPKPKPPTKWELYAKKKGIQKKKRSRMVYDEKAGEWKPRWGYKRVKDQKDDWMLEVPESADKFQDQFEKRAKEKLDRVAKNEYQRLRNLAQMQRKGVKIRPPPPPPGTKPSREQLSQAIVTSKKATASAGVFQKKLEKEQPQKLAGKKRKFEPVTGDMEGERKRTLEMLDKMLSKQPVLDVTKAVNKQMVHEQRTSGGKQKTRQGGQKKSKSQIKRIAGAKKARRKGKVK